MPRDFWAECFGEIFRPEGMMANKFPQTFCSQCGGAFGPGNSGYSHCDQHTTVSALDALKGVMVLFKEPGEDSLDQFERVAAVFHKETGYLRPGKDCVIHSPEERNAAWDAWVEKKLLTARAAIAKATGAA